MKKETSLRIGLMGLGFCIVLFATSFYADKYQEIEDFPYAHYIKTPYRQYAVPLAILGAISFTVGAIGLREYLLSRARRIGVVK